MYKTYNIFQKLIQNINFHFFLLLRNIFLEQKFILKLILIWESCIQTQTLFLHSVVISLPIDFIANLFFTLKTQSSNMCDSVYNTPLMCVMYTWRTVYSNMCDAVWCIACKCDVQCTQF